MCAAFWKFSGSYLPIAEQKTPVLYSKIGTFVSISGFTARKIWRNSCRLGEGNILILSEEAHPIRSTFFLHSELYRTLGTRKLSIISADPRQLDPLFLSSFFFSTPEAFCSNVLRTKRCKLSEKIAESPPEATEMSYQVDFWCFGSSVSGVTPTQKPQFDRRTKQM